MFVLFVRGGVTQSIEDQYLYSWLVLVRGCKLFKLPDIWFKSVKALPTEVRRDVHSLAYRLWAFAHLSIPLFTENKLDKNEEIVETITQALRQVLKAQIILHMIHKTLPLPRDEC